MYCMQVKICTAAVIASLHEKIMSTELDTESHEMCLFSLNYEMIIFSLRRNYVIYFI